MPKDIINVRIGEMNIAKAPMKLKTVLGSCVALIVYDKSAKIGGMAHIFFPTNPGKVGEPLSKYANTAVPALIEETVKAGAKRVRLIGHMVGGNSVFDYGAKAHTIDVGKQNINATMEAAKKERLMLMVSEVGKNHPMRVLFDLSTGDLQVTALEKL